MNLNTLTWIKVNICRWASIIGFKKEILLSHLALVLTYELYNLYLKSDENGIAADDDDIVWLFSHFI